MESVYLETTFISYLVARPSRDLLVAAHQQATQEWWANRRNEFECSISQIVIDEASAGDPAEVQKRLAIISGLPALEITQDAEALTQAILSAGILPLHAIRDAAHVGVASVHAVDYLLTGIASTWQTHKLRGEISMSGLGAENADHLHARRTHGSIASCGKTPSSRMSIGHANNFLRNTTLM